ncbi:MAG: chemotaxis protein CheB [Bacteroidota bacterium]|nr:chemotaxis protein CheB [Bacteroidota bacterium]
MSFNTIVIGASAGGIDALTKLLTALKSDLKLAVIVVQHISPYSDNFMVSHLNNICKLKVVEANEKDEIKSGTIYFAAPDYHLLVEEDKTFSLSAEEKVNFSRPSIDVLFETAADVYGENLIGIILTGANKDGSEGLKTIKKNGGFTIVQDPKCAEVDTMPIVAINTVDVDKILNIKEISDFINGLDE